MLSVIGKVNAQLLARLKNDSDAPYHGKTLDFTAVSSNAPTVFPTLSVVSLGEPTYGNDISGTVQPGILSTVEIKSFTNSTLNDSTKLLDLASDVMLSMGYIMFYGQATLSDVKPFCKVARFRRVVGDGDIL